VEILHLQVQLAKLATSALATSLSPSLHCSVNCWGWYWPLLAELIATGACVGDFIATSERDEMQQCRTSAHQTNSK